MSVLERAPAEFHFAKELNLILLTSTSIDDDEHIPYTSSPLDECRGSSVKGFRPIKSPTCSGVKQNANTQGQKTALQENRLLESR
jgi:hypothetical protein